MKTLSFTKIISGFVLGFLLIGATNLQAAITVGGTPGSGAGTDLNSVLASVEAIKAFRAQYSMSKLKSARDLDIITKDQFNYVKHGIRVVLRDLNERKALLNNYKLIFKQNAKIGSFDIPDNTAIEQAIVTAFDSTVVNLDSTFADVALEGVNDTAVLLTDAEQKMQAMIQFLFVDINLIFPAP